MNKVVYFLFILFSVLITSAQNAVQVGSGSYAEFPPEEVWNVDNYFYGQEYEGLRNDAPYYIHPNMQGEPVPTNDWTTDCFFSQYAGDLWAYPHAVSADNEGINIINPSGFNANGNSVLTGTVLEIGGQGFAPISALAYDWNDIGFTMQSHESSTEFMNVTMAHGMPFVWTELENITNPQLQSSSATPVIQDVNGNSLSFPATTSVFSLTYDGVHYGVHLPAGTTVNRVGGTFDLTFSGSLQYVVVSILPSQGMLSTYDAVARNVPRNTIFSYDYSAENGNLTTTFQLETENLDTQATGGESILALMPHHWRNTSLSIPLMAGAEYTNSIFGTLKSVQGNSITIDYSVKGMPPYMPAPNNLTQTQTDRLNNLITSVANGSAGFNGNTYAKGLGEESKIMLMAKELGHPGYEVLKNNLKTELIDWLTFTETETTERYFAMYPEMGALVGFAPGYGSQVLNDHHFHNGYFIMGASRLMLVDQEFKAQYGEIVKKIAKSYANWLRYGVNDTDFLPFFRTFDPYKGHSWASGLSSGGGPNQESTSESTHAWFALYTLGIALDDPDIIEAGVMGFTLEGRSTMEYWFDQYGENFPAQYQHEYVGILFANSLAFATFFSPDPAWFMGIHLVPSDTYYQYYMNDPVFNESVLQQMLDDRFAEGEADNNILYDNIVDLGDGLGGYYLNFIGAYDPAQAASLLDQLATNEGGSWLTGNNPAATYYTSNSSVSHGLPADGFTSSDYSGGVFFNQSTSTHTYIAYNNSSEVKKVVFYNNGTALGYMEVEPYSLGYETNLNPGIPPSVEITNLTTNQNFVPGSNIVIDVDASDSDGTISEVQLWIDGVNEINDTSAPYSFTLENVQESTFSVRAVAIDNDGIDAQSEAYFLSVGNVPPSITINNPINGAGFFTGDDVDIIVDATDQDGSVASVSFYHNDVEVAVDNNAPYSYTLSNLSYGNHKISAKATDNLGKETVTEDINILAVDTCSGMPTTVHVGYYTYTITSALPNPRVTFIPDPNHPVTFNILHYSLNGEGRGGHGMTLQPDGSYTFDMQAGIGDDIEFYFTNNSMGGDAQRFMHTVGEVCGNNIPPVANAGSNFSVSSSVNSMEVDGSESFDWDGSIVIYSWVQSSGPSATLTNTNQSILQVENFTLGTYVFDLTVTDDDGAQNTDQVTINVSSSIANQQPVVVLGDDFSVDSSQTSFQIDGSGSSDPDGSIIGYLWEIESGPSATLTNENTAILSVSNFVVGEYVFRLIVTDDDGGTASGLITVTVETTLGTADNAFGKNFRLYPNPTSSGAFSIRAPYLRGEVKVEIHNLLGQQLYSKQHKALSSGIDVKVEDLSAGVYLVKLSQNSNSFVTKLIVQ